MRRGTILNFKDFNGIIEFAVKNNVLILLTIFFIAGLFSGVLVSGKYPSLDEYNSSALNEFISQRTSVAFFGIIFDSFLSSMLFITVCFICGASMFGIVLAPLCVGLNGFLYGGLASLLYSSYSLKGIAFHAVLVLPSAIVFIIALILAARESVKFSLVLVKLTMPSSSANLFFDFKNYCGRYLLLCILVLLSALIDAVLSSNFLDSFML